MTHTFWSFTFQPLISVTLSLTFSQHMMLQSVELSENASLHTDNTDNGFHQNTNVFINCDSSCTRVLIAFYPTIQYKEWNYGTVTDGTTYMAGWPSRWASAHISSYQFSAMVLCERLSWLSISLLMQVTDSLLPSYHSTTKNYVMPYS